MKSHHGLLFFPDRRGDTLLDLDHMTVRALQFAACGDVLLIALLHFRLAVEEEIDVVAGQPRIRGDAKRWPGTAGATSRGVTMMTRSVSFC